MSDTVMVVHNSLKTLVYRLKIKYVEINHNYSNLLLDKHIKKYKLLHQLIYINYKKYKLYNISFIFIHKYILFKNKNININIISTCKNIYYKI